MQYCEELVYNIKHLGDENSIKKYDVLFLFVFFLQPVSELDVDYAGSDSLLTDTHYDQHNDLQMFPTMAG